MPSAATRMPTSRRVLRVEELDDWWELARTELGGDDVGEFFDPKEGVFARILHGTDDLMLSATTTHLSLEVAPSV